MKRFSLALSSIVVLALLLTACGGEETATNLPSTNVPPVTVDVTATEVISATEAPATGDLTTTPAVPVTGEENTSRLSNLMDFGVWNQNNEQVGEVEDFVLDLDNTRISYVVVETGGFLDLGDKTVLIPWDSLQLQSSAAGATGGNAFILLADPEFLNNAPDVDLEAVVPGMGQPAGDWDADIRNFWDTGTLPGGTESTPAASGTADTGTSTAGTAVPETTATTTTGGTGTNDARCNPGI
jgi:sporulation protein YlmC with PRC-barrel domain